MILDTSNPKHVATRMLYDQIRKRKAITPERLKARLLEEFSPKLHFLFDPHRYKGVYSGRYGTKSWSLSDALLYLGYERKLRILCARETMKSIKDSVHKLMTDQTIRLGLNSHYEILTTEIRGANGTEIFYAGLKNNISNIKSVEGCDIVWVEEAQSVSKHSWDTLIPTIRKDGSEIWLSWNPDLDEDDTQKRFIKNPPPGAKIVRISYRDNKYFNEMMRTEMEHLKTTDPDGYEHIYEGATRSTVADAVYKEQILAAEKAGRFCRIPYDARKPVDVAFDLGYGDMVAMWFVQAFPFETRLIDYYENTHQAIDHYLKVMQQKEYTYGECILPWDGGAPHVSTGKSTAQMITAKGFRVRLLRQGSAHAAIDQLRTIFPQLFFDATKCEEGISHLRHYQWGPPSPDGKLKREPLHDQHSHASKALEYLAVAIKSPASVKKPETAPTTRRQGGSMAGFR